MWAEVVAGLNSTRVQDQECSQIEGGSQATLIVYMEPAELSRKPEVISINFLPVHLGVLFGHWLLF